ncbi:uncharacterized protein LOC34624103 [Cyclospora cayetanensis]|uniref:Uncharacterized protein LOC34624103 n=1 Tax=Cyclospora cayetanensis TaxID=88456 RepID=A0A6P6RQS4_9EIME|nr:uncharacterized protein LOC34624103 [Cyclospora cayetanensis]
MPGRSLHSVEPIAAAAAADGFSSRFLADTPSSVSTSPPAALFFFACADSQLLRAAAEPGGLQQAALQAAALMPSPPSQQLLVTAVILGGTIPAVRLAAEIAEAAMGPPAPTTPHSATTTTSSSASRFAAAPSPVFSQHGHQHQQQLSAALLCAVSPGPCRVEANLLLQEVQPRMLICGRPAAEDSGAATAETAVAKDRPKLVTPLMLLPASFFGGCDSVLLQRQDLIAVAATERVLPLFRLTYS